jgi:hypothetical protein
MTTENQNIADAAKSVIIEHVDVAEGEAMKLIHFADRKFKVAENAVVAFVKREAHDLLADGDAVVEFAEEKFHIAEETILAFLRLHGGGEVKDETPAGDADTSKAAV